MGHESWDWARKAITGGPALGGKFSGAGLGKSKTALPPAAAWAQPEPAVGGLGFTHRKRGLAKRRAPRQKWEVGEGSEKWGARHRRNS